MNHLVMLSAMVVHLPKLDCTQGTCVCVSDGCKGVGWVDVAMTAGQRAGGWVTTCDKCGCTGSYWEDVTVDRWKRDDWEDWIPIVCILVHCRRMQHFFSLPTPPFCHTTTEMTDVTFVTFTTCAVTASRLFA